MRDFLRAAHTVIESQELVQLGGSCHPFEAAGFIPDTVLQPEKDKFLLVRGEARRVSENSDFL